jgi:hypothetical protein
MRQELISELNHRFDLERDAAMRLEKAESDRERFEIEKFRRINLTVLMALKTQFDTEAAVAQAIEPERRAVACQKGVAGARGSSCRRRRILSRPQH